MQGKYHSETLELTSLVLEGDEPAATAYALDLYAELIQEDAITAPEDVREQVPQTVVQAQQLAREFRGERQEILVGDEAKLCGAGLFRFVDYYQRALAGGGDHYMEMASRFEDTAAFALHAMTARAMIENSPGAILSAE